MYFGYEVYFGYYVYCEYWWVYELVETYGRFCEYGWILYKKPWSPMEVFCEYRCIFYVKLWSHIEVYCEDLCILDKKSCSPADIYRIFIEIFVAFTWPSTNPWIRTVHCHTWGLSLSTQARLCCYYSLFKYLLWSPIDKIFRGINWLLVRGNSSEMCIRKQ